MVAGVILGPYAWEWLGGVHTYTHTHTKDEARRSGKGEQKRIF